MRPRELGFTLLEVLVALLIFAISATALMSGMSQIMSQEARLEEKTFGQWIAENRVSEMQIVGEFPDAGEKKSDVEFAGRKWRLIEKVSNTPNPVMKRLEVSVEIMVDDIKSKPVVNVTSFIGALQ